MATAGGVEEREIPEISFEELRRRLGDPRLAIVNVLPLEAFEEARIPGSRSLPIAELAQRASEVLPDPRQELAVYCGGPT